MTAAELLRSLVGARQVSRRIEPGIGGFEGVATFASDAGALLYREDGELVLTGGWRGPATRVQRWREAGDAIEVRFAGELRDGELLHRLSFAEAGPGTLTAHDLHLCGADRYHGRYELEGGRLAITMRVTGPAKDYVTHTVLTRRTPS